MQTARFVALLLHIFAAVIRIGGMVFLGIVLIPVLRDSSLRAQAVPLTQRTGRRFRNLRCTCLVILVVPGVINLGRCMGSLANIGAAGIFLARPRDAVRVCCVGL